MLERSERGRIMTSSESAATRKEGSPRRKVVGVLCTAIVVVLLSRFVMLGGLLFYTALTSYDSSGSGGPFSSCTSTSASCSDPNILFAALVGILLVAAVLLPSTVGQRVGRFRHGAVAIATFSAAAIIGYAFCIVVLLTAPAPLSS